MGGNSTAEALSASNRSTTMATGVPVALTSAHSQSSAASMYRNKKILHNMYFFKLKKFFLCLLKYYGVILESYRHCYLERVGNESKRH